MHSSLKSALAAAIALAPTAAFAQLMVEEPVIIEEPAMVVEEPAIIVDEPVIVGPSGIMAEDARTIAMMNGMVTVDDVSERWRDGNYEVDGEDAVGRGHGDHHRLRHRRCARNRRLSPECKKGCLRRIEDSPSIASPRERGADPCAVRRRESQQRRDSRSATPANAV